MNDDTKAYFAAVRSDFKVFLQHAFQALNPGTPFLDNWHIDAVIDCLEQGRRGQMRKLALNLPPRHLKSFMVSTAWPAFLLGQDPSVKIIVVSYSDELARALARDFRRIVESDWYCKVFSNVRLTKVTEGEVTTDQGGFRFATSVGGTLTGRGADFIIIDDPIKPDDARSDKARTATNEWYRSTLLSRLDDKERGVLTLVMQRVHVNDLTGFVEGERNFHKLSLSAIALKDEQIALGDGRVHLRKAGEALHPERESLKVLQQMRENVGAGIFNAQYQQAPDAPEGGLFKRKFFPFIDKLPTISLSAELIVSIDSALSTSASADYSAITFLLAQNGKFYVLNAERGHWDYEALKAKAWWYVKRYGRAERPVHFIVESAGSGISLIQHLSASAGRGDGYLTCHHYDPKGDKVARAARTLPFFDEGRVVIVNRPGCNEWVEPFLNEFLSFPNGRYDDQVDSVVQLLHAHLTLCWAKVPI
jgi:predicted phage terminase large subunit-like protein